MRSHFVIFGVILTLFLSGCTDKTANLLQAENSAEFSTQNKYDGRTIPDDVLKRAAYTTLRRGYSHFTIVAVTPSRQSQGFQPSIGFQYGRNPGGFGDPGFANDGLGVGVGVTRGASARIHWKVTMYKSGMDMPSPHNRDHLYDAAAITR